MTRHKNRYVLHEMRLCQEKQESPLGLRGLQTVKKGQQKLAFFDIIKSEVRTC